MPWAVRDDSCDDYCEELLKMSFNTIANFICLNHRLVGRRAGGQAACRHTGRRRERVNDWEREIERGRMRERATEKEGKSEREGEREGGGARERRGERERERERATERGQE